ncbi:tetratricopeptide repeat protein [Kitasatospora sp. NPDC058965]|uniref:tetratricopeptide repeat protein n=1 Tax=Kitasatospora sp. NPDC058965 TaxID=3346682 RepID=UPI0036C8D462
MSALDNAGAEGRPPARPEAATTPVELLAELRLLRAWAGDPSLRDLQRTTGVARSTLAYALDPQRSTLPRLELVLAVVRACGASGPEVEAWRRAWRGLRTASEERRSPTAAPGTAHLPPPLLPGGPGTVAATASTAPRQLPADLADFTGRGPLVQRLQDLLAEAGPHGGPVVLSALNGAGGMGKTTLAVHVAHRALGHFPDGQLHADLHGLDARPADPAEVMGRFLRGLGVAAADVPSDREEREALYRSTLSGRRLLLLLDNARDAAQVRPLLPGSGSCAVLITSRGALPGLDGAHRIAVDVLTDAEALELFTRIVGAEAVAAEPAATREVLRICAGLPLAIRIAGSRLACQPGWTVRTLADRLDDESRRLDELQVEDRAVRASFAVGFAALSPSSARLFRLLGLVPGPTISLPAVLALAGAPASDTEEALWALLAAHLLQPAGPDRYAFHDLIRVYAAEQAAAAAAAERHDGVGRLLRWSLYGADRAARLLTPSAPQATGDGFWTAAMLPLAVSRPAFEDFAAAQSWFDAEDHNLTAAAHLACAATDRELLALGPQLVQAFWASVYVRGEYDPRWEDLCAAAIRAATALGDRAARAGMHKTLGILHLYNARPQRALPEFEQAHALRTEIGDTVGALACTVDIACAYTSLERYGAAIPELETALAGYQAAGDRRKAAVVLNNLGVTCHKSGDPTAAVVHLEASLRLKEELGDVVGQSKSLTSLAEILFVSGRTELAARRGEQALAALQQTGSRVDVVLVLEILVRAYQALHRPAEADRCRTELAQAYTALSAEQSATLKEELTRLTPAQG